MKAPLCLLSAVCLAAATTAPAQTWNFQKRSDRTPDTLDLSRKIHARIVAKAAEEKAAMADYKGVVPRTGAEYHMVALAGGEFTLGSPVGAPHRRDDEGPTVRVRLDPFWIGKYEVTWDEYSPFETTAEERWTDGSKKDPKPGDVEADMVSSPTSPYMAMDWNMGTDGFPAISMTQHAALKYCQWLSAQTGHFYRLPTEAEWEYACRAGTDTAYSFGDDAAALHDYAWSFDNSAEGYEDVQSHKVGLKKPNAWGLHDMHGNVMEWVLGRHDGGYATLGTGTTLVNPMPLPQTSWDQVVRGGSWNDDPPDLRSAARRAARHEWQASDPQLPKSLWYITDLKCLGFRLVRPKNVPSAEEMHRIWNCAWPEKPAKKGPGK